MSAGKQRLWLATGIVFVAFGLTFAGVGEAAKRTLSPNPANERELLRMRMDANAYDGASGCVRRVPKGMKGLIRFMKRNTRRSVYYGTIRCDGGVHGTGRALDWMLDARKRNQKRMAMRVINTWVADDRRRRDNALARRMGVQMIIYNCKIWMAGDSGWHTYSACSGGRRNADPTQGHIDHIHIELTQRSAKLRTSFWRSSIGESYLGKAAGDSGPGGGVGA